MSMRTRVVGSGSIANPVTSTPLADMSPAAATDSQDQEASTVPEIDTATHIVVEHLRTGTVKTHVFASKDGQPSLLGHVIPDTTCTSEVLGPLLDVKIQVLQDLVQTSLETTRSESLSKVEHLTHTLETRESMVATQVSLAASATIEHQIKTELTPQLDKIEKLLSLRNLNDLALTAAAATSSDIPSPKSETASKSSSLDHLNQDDATDSIAGTCSPGGSPRAESAVANAGGRATSSAGRSSLVLEKLQTIEHQVGALCKVVIDGHIPPLESMVPGSGGSDIGKQTRAFGHHSEDTSSISEGATTTTAANAYDRLASMRNEMLNIPESLSGANAKMQELIDVLARSERPAAGPRTIDAAVSTEDETQLEAIHRELKEWKENLGSYMIAHQAGLGNVDTQVQIVESEVRAMSADHQAWKRTHQQSLSVYLKYMYHVYKRTASVDGHIHQVLEQVQHHTGIEQEQRTKFAEELATMRSEILSILDSLPDTVANALKRSSDSTCTSHPGSLCAARVSAVGEAASYVPGTRSMHSEPGGPGSRVLNMPCSEYAAARSAGGPQDASQSGSRTPTPMPGSNPDPVLEKLIQTVGSLQASIASMIEKYSEFTAMISASPPPPAPAEIPNPPPREPSQIEHRIRTLEELLFQMNQNSSTRRSVQDGCASHGHILPEMGHPGTRSHGGPPPPPAPGYNYSRSRHSSVSEHVPATAMASSSSSASGPLPHPQPEASSIFTSDFCEELGFMSKNLTELVNVVTATTHSLSEGQNFLHHELQREIQRVIDTIHPPEIEEDQQKKQELLYQEQLAEAQRLNDQAIADQEAALEAERKRLEDEKAAREAEALAKVAAEERAQALESIALIPHIVTTLENGNMERVGNVDEFIMHGIKESRAAVAKVEAMVEGCHADVQNILQGSIQDSSRLVMIQDQVEGISDGMQGASNIVLKNHMEEVLRTGADVLLMMEDVKRIGNQTLAQQQTLEQRLDEWHLRQDERVPGHGQGQGEQGWEAWAQRTDQGLQVLDRKHDHGLRELQAMQRSHADTAAQMSAWHERHDQDLRGSDEWRHRHHDDIKGWHLNLEGELEAWHRKHEEGLHMWHRSHDERLQALEKNHCHSCRPGSTLPVLAADNSNGSCTRGAISPGDHLSAPYSGTMDNNHLGQSHGACCGESAAAAFPYDSNPARHRAREMFEEFLYNIIPGPNTSCLACGHLCSSTAPDCSSFQGSYWTSGIIVPEPLPQSPVDNDDGPCASAVHEGASSHSRGVASQTNGLSVHETTLERKATPQPSCVHIDCASIADNASLARGSMRSEGSESAIKKELVELQMKHDELLRASQDGEETLNRFMTSVMQKNLELATLQDEKSRLEAEKEALRMAIEQQLAAHQEAMARRKRKLNARKAVIERMYREGLGLSTTDRADDVPGPAVLEDNDPASDAESVDTVEIPRYSLMNEAAAQLRQALEELKMQKAALHYDIRTLEDRKIHLVEHVAKAEKVLRTDDAISSISASQREGKEAEKENAVEKLGQGQEDGRESEGSDEDYADEDDTRSRPTVREGRGSSRAGSMAGGPRSRTLTRQQRRLSQHAGRGVSMAPTKGRAKRGDRREEKVPQLEADIQICKDGILSETLLSSKTILTEEQFERIRTTRVEAGEKENAQEEDEVWSLNCDFRVKMVHAP